MPNEIKLFGEIGKDITATDIKMQLSEMDRTQPLIVRIHSEGGSVMDGLTLYDEFKAYPGPKKAVIESAAFSIASYIPMAFDQVEITENGYLMIHNPWMGCEGDDADHYKAAEALSKLKASMVEAYCAKTGKSHDEVLAVMQRDTWINAKEALNEGYVDSIARAKTYEERAFAKRKIMPQGVLRSLCGDRSDAGENRETTREKSMSDTKPVAASLAEIKAAFPKAKADFVLNCLERNLPLASVMTEMVSVLENENMALKAELDNYKAQAAAMAQEEEQVIVTEKEDEMARAKAKSGVKPIAKGNSESKPSAKLRWQAEFSKKVSAGMRRDQAVFAIEREFPGLRQEMVAEVNAAR